MSIIVSDQSVSSKLKTALLGIGLPAVAMLHAFGVDWGASSDEIQLARDAVIVATWTTFVVLVFAIVAQRNRSTVGEPVAVAGAVGGFLGALVGLFLGFEWFSNTIVLTVSALVGAFLVPFGITIARSQVTPAADAAAALAAKPGPGPTPQGEDPLAS